MIIYKLYDSTGACFLSLGSYEGYLSYFLNILKPFGKGTRYVYSHYDRVKHIFVYGMLVIDNV